jgi:hypothetical protein
MNRYGFFTACFVVFLFSWIPFWADDATFTKKNMLEETAKVRRLTAIEKTELEAASGRVGIYQSISGFSFVTWVLSGAYCALMAGKGGGSDRNRNMSRGSRNVVVVKDPGTGTAINTLLNHQREMYEDQLERERISAETRAKQEAAHREEIKRLLRESRDREVNLSEQHANRLVDQSDKFSDSIRQIINDIATILTDQQRSQVDTALSVSSRLRMDTSRTEPRYFLEWPRSEQFPSGVMTPVTLAQADYYFYQKHQKPAPRLEAPGNKPKQRQAQASGGSSGSGIIVEATYREI